MPDSEGRKATPDMFSGSSICEPPVHVRNCVNADEDAGWKTTGDRRHELWECGCSEGYIHSGSELRCQVCGTANPHRDAGREQTTCRCDHDHANGRVPSHCPNCADCSSGRETTPPCTCGAHPWADPEDYDHGASCPHSAGREATLVCPRCMDNLVRHEGEFGYYCGRCNESWSWIPGRHATTIKTPPARKASPD